MNYQLLERIRDHATALDQVAPPIQLDDVRGSTRHGRSPKPRHPLAAAAAAALVVVGGLVAINAARRTDRELSVALPSTSVVPALDASGVEYRLNLSSAELLIDERVTVGSADGAVWKDAQTETYLSLVVRGGLASVQPAPTGVGRMRQLDDFPADLGQAWITDLEQAEATSPLRLQMWWTRPDGDVWLLTTYWYEPTGIGVEADNAVSATTSWATSIVSTADPDAPYQLNDAAVADSKMELLFAQHGGEYRSRTQAWMINGHQVTLVTTEQTAASGLQNLLDVAPTTATVIAGQPGWVIRTSTGEVRAGWWAAYPVEAWSELTVPAELAQQSTEIINSIDVRTAPPDISESSPFDSTRTSAAGQMPPPTELAIEDVGGLVIVDAGNDQSYANNTLERVDPDTGTENGPYVVVIRHRSGSLVDKTAVITYQPRTTTTGDQGLVRNASTGVSALTVVRGADQVVVRALGLSADQVTAIADATQIVDARLLVNQSPELADFVIVAAGPQRPPRIHEARYGCDSLGEADALGAFCYTGLTTSPGFEAAVYAGEFRPGPTINAHLTLVSTVGGGNGTLAWEPQPGVIAFVGYSGSNLGDQQIDALARIAQRVAIVPPDDWRATQPQAVTQSNEW